MARLPKPRRKIPIQKIENQGNLETTFSKRRTGVYKKASELSLLGDCDVAVIIFSPEDNIFAFGEPSVEQIIDTFMAEDDPDQQQNSEMEGHQDRDLYEPGNEEEMVKHKASIEDEKTREKTITNYTQVENCVKKWWLIPVEDLTLDEAEEMVKNLEEFKHSVDPHGTHAQTSSTGFTLPPHPYLASTSSSLDPSDKGKAFMEY